MLGWALLLLVIVLAAVAAVRATMNYPCHVQKGWWRVLPDGSRPMETGRARGLYQVVRRAAKAGAKSFNYNEKTGDYELFADWLVNFTQPADVVGSTIQPGPHMTGVLADPAHPPPAPCCEKIKCEMRAFGLDPDGNMKRDWAAAGPFYDVSKAAGQWPKSADGKTLPPDAQPRDQFVDQELTASLKKPGAKAPAGLNSDGTLRFAQSGGCGGSCDFCAGPKCNPTAAFWHGCNARGQLFTTAAQTAVYAV